MKYKAKQVDVEAFQYKSGVKPPFEGVRKKEILIRYSADKQLYYCQGSGKAEHWFGVDKLTDKPESGQIDGHVSVTPPGGSPYFRKCLPFAFWSVKSGVEEVVSDPSTNELFLDYASSHRWEFPEGHSEVFDVNEKRWRVLFDGEFVIKTADGLIVMKADKFNQLYEAAE